MTDSPLTEQQLTDIEARVAAATVCPEAKANGRMDGEHTWGGSSFTHVECQLCRYTRPRGDRSEETAALLTEIRQLRTERRRFRTAWRMARTRALATGGAADRYAARAREGQAAMQDMLGALIGAQMERDEARAEVTALRIVLAKQ